MVKQRIGVVVRETIAGSKSHNESADLVQLTEKYKAFCINLRSLIESLQQHYNAMANVGKTRVLVRFHVNKREMIVET
jgi:hypothetical protein